ncbi:hypothetical protein MO973_08115 [Paenibacillus sp. TRM 82003]|nr:hypothetical protein [Paenibacillus sp. TRM 82003]
MISDDELVLAVVLVALIGWGWFAFRRWLYRKPEVKTPEAAEGARPKGEAVDILTEHGYEVTFGKWKVDVTVLVDDARLGSSLFVDYVAKREGLTYVVKLARTRKPLDLTVGSAVREQLLTYALLYEDTSGVLYVDVGNRKVHQIRFELEL